MVENSHSRMQVSVDGGKVVVWTEENRRTYVGQSQWCHTHLLFSQEEALRAAIALLQAVDEIKRAEAE